MVKLRKSEEGYALLLVLFLVVFIMAISAVFMRGALSNAKQEQKVDKNHLSVVAAEMGVEYYTTLFTNKFLSVRDGKWDEAWAEVEVENEALIEAEKTELTPDEVWREVTERASIRIKDELEVLKGEENYPSSEIYFENPGNLGFKVEFAPDSRDIVIMGDIVGHYPDGRKTELQLELTFLMPQMKADEGSNGGNNNQPNTSINLYNLYPKNVTAPPCGTNLKNTECIGEANTNIGASDNSTIYFPDGYSTSNDNNKNLNGAKIYSDGDFEVKNINGMQGVSFLIDGNFTAKNINGQGLRNSNIIVNGGMEADQVKLSNSSIIVRGAVKINDHLTMSQNSRVCVAGSLHVVKKLEKDPSSKIYLWGTIDPHGKGIEESDIVMVHSVEQLLKECGAPDDSTNIPAFDNEWNPPIVNVEYN